MNQAQYNLHNMDKAPNEADFALQPSAPVDDILIRMEKLRALASAQNKRAHSARRRQFSFAF